MLTEFEILAELRRIGIKEPSLLKDYLRDFEEYMEKNYDMKILKSNEDKTKGERWDKRELGKFDGNRFPICKILVPLFIATRVKKRAEEKTEGE